MSTSTKFIIAWLTTGFLSSCVFYPKTVLQVIASVLLIAFMIICVAVIIPVLGNVMEYWWGKIWCLK